jgi:hypothetical protein
MIIRGKLSIAVAVLASGMFKGDRTYNFTALVRSNFKCNGSLEASAKTLYPPPYELLRASWAWRPSALY